MSALQHYSHLIDSIFGANTTTFDTAATHTNNVIGALEHPTEYMDFKSNFTERLKRLQQIYRNHPDYLAEILKQVNEISSEKNWEGAFAELSAYDHLNSDFLSGHGYMTEPIKPNVTLPKERSLANECGKQETNLDGFVEDSNLYFDVKCFKDNISEILEGIYKEFRQHINFSDVHFIGEYPSDMSYEDYRNKRQQLLNEMKDGITIAEKPRSFRSKVIHNLALSIRWGGGILTGTKTYEPYSHAENLHKTVFNYANKLMKAEPTIIVMVVFPWYNLTVTSFAGSNIKFYRSLARRVFCQYKLDNTPFKSFNSKFTGNQTIYEVSKYISGIIFLEDDTILSKVANVSNVKSYTYLNPNAMHPIQRSIARQFITGLRNTEFDHFEHDNY